MHKKLKLTRRFVGLSLRLHKTVAALHTAALGKEYTKHAEAAKRVREALTGLTADTLLKERWNDVRLQNDLDQARARHHAYKRQIVAEHDSALKGHTLELEKIEGQLVEVTKEIYTHHAVTKG